MTKFDQLKERFPNLIPVQELRSNVSIVELATQYGYLPKPHKGKNRPVLENVIYNDVILIKNAQDASQQVYQQVGNFADSGTIFNFIRNRLSTVFFRFNRSDEDEFRNIVNVLYDYLRIDSDQVAINQQATSQLVERGSKASFSLDLFDIRLLDKDNYLTTRHISSETINSSEFSHKIVTLITYYDPQKKQVVDSATVKDNPQHKHIQFSNVAFPYYDGLSNEVTGLELRNENIKLHAPGSDRTNSVFVSNPPLRVEYFFILESAIDALSHKQLRCMRGNNAFDSVYFSTGGQLTPKQVDTIARYISSFKKAPKWKINLAFDNDVKGHIYDLQFIQQLLAAKFPLHSVAVGLHKIGYALPNEEAYNLFKKELIDRIKAYNKTILLKPPALLNSDTSELTNLLITVDETTDQITLSISELCAPLSFLTKSLLEISRLNQRLCINKSITKDFNQDLKQEIITTYPQRN